MKKLTIGFTIIWLVVLLGPFLIPVPPLNNTQPAQTLAEPDSRFIDIGELTVHYKLYGQGEPVFILLHGFGASTYSWREVTQPLATIGTVIAFDRPAFGLTERPMAWDGDNPYSPEFQSKLVIDLMNELQIDRAILVGNSAGGAIATLTALDHPNRIEALVLVDAAIYNGGGTPSWAAWLIQTPQMEHIGPLIARRIQDWGLDFARSAWHNPELITDEILEGYTRPLQVDNWDRALWFLTSSSKDMKLDNRLDELKLPLLVITGDDDRIVPTEDSIRLSSEIQGAELVVIPACGHVPHEECPEPFLTAMFDFVSTLP